jgi:hypothetical protein
MRSDSPYKNIADVRRASEPPKCGSGGATGTGFYFPRLLEETVGAKFNIVLGYQGGGPIDLAVEKGEIHCRAMTIESFFAREPFHTLAKKKFVSSIAQSEQKRDARLPDTPAIYELMDQYKTPEQSRRVATVILAGGFFGRPMVGPAGVAPDRLKILRNAFASVLKDPALKVDAEKRGYDLEPVGGVEMEKLAKEVMSTSGSYRKNEKGARQLVIKLAIFDRSDFQQRFKAPICPARAHRVERLCHLQISFNASKTVQSYHSSSHCQVKRLRQSLTPAPKQLIAKHRSAPKSSLKLRRVRR